MRRSFSAQKNPTLFLVFPLLQISNCSVQFQFLDMPNDAKLGNPPQPPIYKIETLDKFISLIVQNIHNITELFYFK